MKTIQLKQGDTVYRYVSFKGGFRYKVIGENKIRDTVQYVIECEACSHGYRCEVLITQKNDISFRFVSLLNDDEDDSQRCWHDDDRDYFLTLEEMHKDTYKKFLDEKQREIDKYKGYVNSCQKSYDEIKALLDAVILKEVKE